MLHRGTTENSKTIATMKNLFKKMMLVAVAAMAFVACQNEPEDINVTAKQVTVNISGDLVDTRSYFGEPDETAKTYPSKWAGGEKVAFSLNEAALVEATNTLDGTRATFSVALADDDKTEGTIYAFSPKGVFDDTNATNNEGGFTRLNTQYHDAFVVIPEVQNPSTTSVDPSVHLLAGAYSYTDGLPTSVNMQFKHVAAYAKMTIKDFTEVIKKVEVTASEPLAGSSCWYYYAGEKVGQLTNANKTTITVMNPAESNYDFWFGCAPADLASGTLSVKVYAANGDTYTKALNIAGKNFAFNQGGVSRFTVSITAENKDEVVDMTIEDGQYVIAGEYDGKYYALPSANKTTAGTIDYSEITVTDGKVAAADAAGYVWTVAAADGGYTFFNGEQYLTGTGNNTSLKTEETSAVWALDDSVDYGYKFISPKEATRYLSFRYGDTKKFGTYKNYGDGEYFGVHLLPIDGVVKSRLAKPALTAEVQNANEIVVSWSAVDGAKNYTVTLDGGTPETITATTKTYTGLEYSKEYTITVVANPENEEQYVASEEASATVNTGADPSVVVTEGYRLITTLAELTTGEYVIAAKVGDAYYAMGNTIAAKISGVSVTVSANKVISTSDAEGKVWNITRSGANITIKSGSNYLKYGSSTSFANGGSTAYNWTPRVSDNDTFRIIATATASASTVRAIVYRASSYQQFGAYSQGNVDGTEYYDVMLFKKTTESGGGEEPADPVKLTMSALTTTATSDSITVSWTAVSGAQNYAVSLNGGAATTVTGTSHTFTGLTASTSYDVSVVAKGDGVNYTDSDAATATETTEAAQSGGGASSKTVTIDSSYFTGSYNKTEPGNTFTVDGYDFYGFYTLKSTTKIQMYKGQGYVANKSSLGKITKIVVTYDASDANKNCTLYVGSSERPSTTTVSASKSGNVHTYDCSAGDYSFFKLKNGSGAGYVTSIEVTFEN